MFYSRKVEIKAPTNGVEWLAKGYHYLRTAGIPTKQNLVDLVHNAQYARWLARGLYYLQEAEILNQANFEALIGNARYADGLGSGLCKLQAAEILDQANFEALIGNAPYVDSILHDIPELSQERFDAYIYDLQRKNTLKQGLFNCLSHVNSTPDLQVKGFSSDIEICCGV